MSAFCQKDDVGVQVVLQVYQSDGSTPYDMSPYASPNNITSFLQLWASPPSGQVKQWDASVSGDGTSGILLYTTIAGDIDEVGTWNIQSYATTGTTNVKHSSLSTFEVSDNV